MHLLYNSGKAYRVFKKLGKRELFLLNVPYPVIYRNPYIIRSAESASHRRERLSGRKITNKNRQTEKGDCFGTLAFGNNPPIFGFVRRETPSYFFSATFLQHFFIASHFLPSLQALIFLQHFFWALSQTFSHFSVLAFLQQDFFTGSCAATLRAKTPMHRRSINFFMMFLFLVLWNVFLIERLKRLSIWFDRSEARRFNPSPANVRQNAILDLTKHT